jgi:hypothetical protein
MCCRMCRTRKTRKIVTYENDRDGGAGLAPRGQKKRSFSPSAMSRDREANEEGARDDEPLLSERPEPHFASTKARMVAAGKDWQRDLSRSFPQPPTQGSWAEPTQGRWADPSRPYGGMPSTPNGYPGYAGGGQYNGAPPFDPNQGIPNYDIPYANVLSYGNSPLDYPPPPLLPPPMPPQYSQLQAGNAMRPF